jgi:hypothetical protein
MVWHQPIPQPQECAASHQIISWHHIGVQGDQGWHLVTGAFLYTAAACGMPSLSSTLERLAFERLLKILTFRRSILRKIAHWAVSPGFWRSIYDSFVIVLHYHLSFCSRNVWDSRCIWLRLFSFWQIPRCQSDHNHHQASIYRPNESCNHSTRCCRLKLWLQGVGVL